MAKTKRERFVDIAGKRTNRIIGDLHLLGNCSNKNNYEYSEEDVRKMFAAIEEALREAKGRYSKSKGKSKFTF